MLLESQGLAVQRAVDVGEFALEAVVVLVVLAPRRRLGVRQLETQQLEALAPEPRCERKSSACSSATSSLMPGRVGARPRRLRRGRGGRRTGTGTTSIPSAGCLPSGARRVRSELGRAARRGGHCGAHDVPDSWHAVAWSGSLRGAHAHRQGRRAPSRRSARGPAPGFRPTALARPVGGPTTALVVTPPDVVARVLGISPSCLPAKRRASPTSRSRVPGSSSAPAARRWPARACRPARRPLPRRR